MKSNIIKALEQMEKEDIYSLILFVLYKMKNVPEYSVLSELVYLLDNTSFQRFMTYFAGETIKVPKIEDLKGILDSLLFYERKMNTDMTDDEILFNLNISNKDKPTIFKNLDMISQIVQEYDFARGKKNE